MVAQYEKVQLHAQNMSALQASGFYHPLPVFDLKNILGQVVTHPKNYAKPKGEKKISCPRKLLNPSEGRSG